MFRIAIVRDSIVRIVRMLTEKKVQVTQRGSTAYVSYNPDGTPRVVNIPHIPDDASEDLLVATQGFLDHEVAHVLFTDYAAVKKASEMGVASLHNIIEDSFIERKMAVAFAGSGYNLSEMGAYFLKNYTDTKLKGLAAGDPQIEGLLIVPAIRAWAGQKVFQDYMDDGDKWSLITRITDRLKSVSHRCATIKNSMEALDLAVDMRRLLEVPPELPKEAPESRSRRGSSPKSGERRAGERPSRKPKSSGDDEPMTPMDDEPTGEEAAAGGESGEEPTPGITTAAEEPKEGAAPGRIDEEEDDADDDGLTAAGRDDDLDDDEGDDDEEDEEEGEPGEDEEGATKGSPAGPGGAHASSGGGPVGAGGDDDLYKAIESEIEKDFDEELSKLISKKAASEMEGMSYKIYTTDLDRVEPLVIRPGTFKDEYLKTLQDAVDHMVGPLQKDFERAIAAKSATTWSGGHRSGRLHAAALSRLTTGDDRIFRRKHINNGKDVAVSLLVDCSGSMASGGKIRAAAYAAYALASVLDRMGIANEVLGFTTKGEMPKEMFHEERTHGFRYARTQPLYMPIFKGFKERMSTETKKRFAALPHARWLNENVDGECVQIAARRLAARKEARKVLFVFSDGSPACPGDWHQLHTHLIKSVQEVERGGVEVMGIGIADNSAARYYPKHVLLTEIADLPTTVIGQIKKILMK